MAMRARSAKSSVQTPLAVARVKRGLSLLHLAEAIDYDKGNLSRIERGIMRPSAEVTIKLYEFFGGSLSRDEIMFREFHTVGKKPVRRAEAQEAQ